MHKVIHMSKTFTNGPVYVGASPNNRRRNMMSWRTPTLTANATHVGGKPQQPRTPAEAQANCTSIAPRSSNAVEQLRRWQQQPCSSSRRQKAAASR